MQILNGTFFQRSLSSSEFALIGFVSLSHPVLDKEIYLMFNNSLLHIPNYSLTENDTIQGFSALLKQPIWPITQVGHPVRFICIDEKTLSYIVYSASPYKYIEGQSEQFFTIENDYFKCVPSLMKTEGSDLYQLFSYPIWSNLTFEEVSLNPSDSISFAFYERGYPILKQLVNNEIDKETAQKNINMSPLEQVYFKKFLTPDNSYSIYLKSRLENFQHKRITPKKEYFDQNESLKLLVSSLIHSHK